MAEQSETMMVGFDRTSRRHLTSVGAAREFLLAGIGCRLSDGTDNETVMAVETAAGDWLEAVDGPPVHLVLTARRAAALGLAVEGDGPVTVDLEPGTSPALLRRWIDPTDPTGEPPRALEVRAASPLEAAAVELCKIAGLLPAALVSSQARHGIGCPLVVEVGAVAAYGAEQAAQLTIVTKAEVPLADAAKTRFIAFRSSLGGAEQYAVVIGRPEEQEAPLCRLHSRCFTGDLFHSLRCDCGDQLRGAVREMEDEGGGIILYLDQEGRGIGLVNKLRAYTLQDGGADTVDANTRLGFEPDERDFKAAATMLQCLEMRRVRLMTNNPDKLAALARHGIEVVERVPHSYAANRHNRFYLETKMRKSGHIIALEELRQATRARRGAA